MESGSDAEALRDAERARDAWAGAVALPPGHDVAIGGAVAVQVATTVVGLTVDAPWALWALAGGLVLFGVVAAIQLWRFTRLNGVRVAGFASRVVFGTAATASLAEGVSLVAGYAAAVRELWWLVALISVAGGVLYVLSARRWLWAYRREPARFGAGESTLWLALAVGLAVAGLVLLVVQGR